MAVITSLSITFDQDKKQTRDIRDTCLDELIQYTNLFNFHRMVRFPKSCLIAVTHVRDVAKAATLLVTKYVSDKCITYAINEADL